ncbi:S-ribosylhomocysteine lyase [Vagococcus silagei]|uniref:S-ribosylhomocysteine lyase n=1 Tax=Vagococcus silagei TaxID=2508885 RepID=A0A4S3B1G9_9ENTE|nr:S-ribosylhomocysteine lyase [Vagococcus silagei]THB60612.1 S-ribosylhomocysteine lyase [Vagococcus silagei]
MAEVESFTLNHDIVKAPYVRLIAEETGLKGDVIANYDLRFVQPNQQEMPTGVIHTIEHLLADLLRDELPGIIDCSPFGCRTGFHLITWGVYSSTEVAKSLTKVLTKIVNDIEWEDVQGTARQNCGNYRDHSLVGAKEWCRQVIEQGVSDDAFKRQVVE